MSTLTLRDAGFLAGLVPGGDPFRSFRTLILHGNGTNGSAVFVDSSPSPAQLALDSSGPTLSTTQSKFGGSSTLFQVGGGSINFSPGTKLSFPGDFTIESWVFFPSVPSVYAAIFEARAGARAEPYVVGFRTVSGLITPEFYTGSVAVQASAAVPLNTWTHLAWVRSGSTLTTYVNKTASGTATVSGTMAPTGSTIYIGRLPFDNATALFFLDELIVTKDIALTTAQFAFDAQVPDF